MNSYEGTVHLVNSYEGTVHLVKGVFCRQNIKSRFQSSTTASKTTYPPYMYMILIGINVDIDLY